MWSYFYRKSLVGLDIGSGAIKLVQLKRSKRGYRLEKFGVLPINPELIVDGTVMDSSHVSAIIRELFAKESVRVKNVALSVSGRSVIIKKVNLPLMKASELREFIKWEAEPFIPFDMNDVNVDFHILEEQMSQAGENQMPVLLVAVKKDKLAEYTNLVMEAGLNPVVGDVDAFALGNMYTENYDAQKGETVALVNICASLTTIHIIQGGTFTFTRDISAGGQQYNEAFQRELGVSFEEAERIKCSEPVEGVDTSLRDSIIRRLHSELIVEIVRSFDYFKNTFPNESVDRILVSGGSSKLPDLIPLLEERSAIPAEPANPFQRIEVPPDRFDLDWVSEMAPQAAVGVGLALRQVRDTWYE